MPSCPTVNVLDDLETRLGAPERDESVCFALICRSYRRRDADYEYRRPASPCRFPVPGRCRGSSGLSAYSFATRWKRSIRRSSGRRGGGRATLPSLAMARMRSCPMRGSRQRDQPPPVTRRHAGGPCKRMRFRRNQPCAQRLKEAKGHRTPRTRAEIIKGLKRQNLLAADGKLVLPIPRAATVELLRGAAPAPSTPGPRLWEMRLTEVSPEADFRAVIGRHLPPPHMI